MSLTGSTTLHGAIDRLIGAVTTHNRLAIVLILLLTVGVFAGAMVGDGGTAQGVNEDAIGDTEVYQAAEYISDQYASESTTEPAAVADVFVRAEDNNALSKSTLLAALEYQSTVIDELEGFELHEDGIYGPPNAIAHALIGETDADLSAQIAAIESATEAEIADAASTTFTGGEETQFYLPTSFEPGTAAAEGFRMTVPFATAEETATGSSVPTEAQRTLHDTAGSFDDPAIFTDGQFAYAEINSLFMAESLWLVLPPILLVLIVILGFAYRDLTDVAIGFIGSIVSLLWTFGLMGWMGLLNQTTSLVVPVLIAALSIDFGFHVFMRYREHRGPDDGVRTAVRHATAAVGVAFLLVTITAAIGFLANLTNPMAVIRDLGIAITLGVVSALIIFTTLVPALKVSADGLWERFGFDRHKTALGKGRYLSRVLSVGPAAAKRAGAVVIVLALLVSVVGGLAYTELDREPFQNTDFDEVAEWKTELPGPMAFEAHESDLAQQMAFATGAFQADRGSVTDDGGGQGYTQMLIRGDDVATADGMATLAAGHEAAATADEEVVLRQGGEVHLISPLSAMQGLAEQDPAFAETFDAHDTDGDGVPDRDIGTLLDAFHETAPAAAERVLERTDDGTYASMLLYVPAYAGFGTERADVMNGIADEMADAAGMDVIAVGSGTLNAAELGQIANGIVVTMGLALVGVLFVLAAVYWLVHRRPLLGVLTVLPIGLALGLVFGAMYLLDQPLTMLTAVLVSITIGLGIDYNIHVSDRFAQELANGRDTMAALRETVTGTGGALLGSMVTSGGAFGLLMLIPHPQFVSFGLIVALALSASFLLSVFVLPSLLYLYAEYGGTSPTATSPGTVAEGD